MPDNAKPKPIQTLNDLQRDSSKAVPLSSGVSRDEEYTPYPFPNFADQPATDDKPAQPDIDQQTLTLAIELGHQLLDQQSVQTLQPGSRIMLKQQATETVELYVKQQCVGQGELLIRDNKLCIRITRLLANRLRRSA